MQPDVLSYARPVPKKRRSGLKWALASLGMAPLSLIAFMELSPLAVRLGFGPYVEFWVGESGLLIGMMFAVIAIVQSRGWTVLGWVGLAMNFFWAGLATASNF